jgi:ATP-dependent Lon protease
MKAEENESPKSKPRLNIPEGAMVIIPLRSRVLFPSMIMPVTVRRPERLHAVEESVRKKYLLDLSPNVIQI